MGGGDPSAEPGCTYCLRTLAGCDPCSPSEVADTSGRYRGTVLPSLHSTLALPRRTGLGRKGGNAENVGGTAEQGMEAPVPMRPHGHPGKLYRVGGS